MGGLVVDHDALVIPGTAFLPDDRCTFRVSLSNADRHALTDFADRLTAAGSGRHRADSPALHMTPDRGSPGSDVHHPVRPDPPSG